MYQCMVLTTPDISKAANLREGSQKTETFTTRRRPLPPSPSSGTFFHQFSTPPFLLQSNLTYMKRILHMVPFKHINSKSNYIFFKIDYSEATPTAGCLFQHIHRLLNCYLYIYSIKFKLCAKCVLAVRE